MQEKVMKAKTRLKKTRQNDKREPFRKKKASPV
jgi:hypothetical protein